MTIVFFVCAAFTLTLFCYGTAEAAWLNLAAPQAGEPEEIIGLHLSKTGMRAPSTFFTLREENGETLFSTSEFGLENVSVPPEYMRKLRGLAKKHGFARMKEKDMSRGPHIPDAPMYGMTMYWPDNRSLRLNYWPARDELENFFHDLVDACVNKAGAPEDISAMYYTYMHNDDRTHFRFELFHDDGEGKFLFNAYCYMSDLEKVTLRRAPVDPADVRRLRGIVREHGIVNMKGNPVYQGRSAPEPPYTRLDIHWPQKILRLNRPESGAEELEEFFRALALANKERWEPIHVLDAMHWLTYICNSPDKAESFMFHLREVSASTQLYAQCTNAEGEKLDFYERVDDKYMDQLREIVKKHGLIALAKTKEQRTKKRSAADPYTLNMDWSFEPGLSLRGHPPGGEELEKFFRALADEYK